MADTTLDARNLVCPLPILKTKKALRGVEIGQTVEVLATDPNTAADMTAFCDARGHTLVTHDQDGLTHRFVVRREV